MEIKHTFPVGLLLCVMISMACVTTPAMGGEGVHPINQTLAAIPDNTWVRVADGNKLAPPSVIQPYSGMAYDSKHHKLLVFGGGHKDYWGNEVWTFDINTLTWSKMYEPVPKDIDRAQYASSQYRGAIFYPNPNAPLSEARPMTRHTYDTVEFIASQGVMFASGRYTWGNGGDGYCWGDCDDTWTYDLDTNQWTFRNSAGGPVPKGETGAAAYDPVAGLIVFVAGGETWVYDVGTDSWTQKSTTGNPPGSIESTLEYDSARHVMYFFGGEYPTHNELWRYDLLKNAWTRVNPSGQSPPAAGGYGLAYDSANDVLVVFRGGSGTWVYTPQSNTWAQQTPTTGNPPPPSGGYVHGDLKYDPVNNVIFLLTKDPNWLTETWAYRYGQTIRPKPPTQLRVQ